MTPDQRDALQYARARSDQLYELIGPLPVDVFTVVALLEAACSVADDVEGLTDQMLIEMFRESVRAFRAAHE